MIVRIGWRGLETRVAVEVPRRWIVALLVLTAASCSAGPRPRLGPEDWSALPQRALSTQRLLRAQYDGPEGKGAFRLILRLGAAADEFDVTASDALGRPLWALQARGRDGLLMDSRSQRFCRLASEVQLPAGLGLRLPLAAVPRLLLGRLPVAAAPATTEVLDATGRRWTWNAARGELAQWTLWDGGEPAVWWSRRGGESVLSIRSRATQVRWHEVVAEALREPLAALRPPTDYEEGACAGDGVS